ncbi:MAG: VOC family protein [Mycobacteriales bacterium]
MSRTTYEGQVIFSADTKETAKWMIRGLGFQRESTEDSDDFGLWVPVYAGTGTVEFYLHPSENPPPNQKLGSFRTDNVDQHMELMLELGCVVHPEQHTDGAYDTPWGTRLVNMVSPETIEFRMVSDLVEGQELSSGNPDGS